MSVLVSISHGKTPGKTQNISGNTRLPLLSSQFFSFFQTSIRVTTTLWKQESVFFVLSRTFPKGFF